MTTPDIAGFQEAQDRLNDELGEDVTFIAVEPKVWPAGTPVDRETGEPLDPIIEPESGGGEIATVVRCTPIEGAIRAQDPTRISPSGVRDTEELVFSVKLVDTPLVADAVYVDHNGERYHVTDVKNDDDRTLVFTEPT
jgi:hypothetical protein